ncbi:hypothetical protein DSO57_1007283 [Entomophthora muscae]|uniref:Uncharacterized protein n=1 Tax=Entomophthora muscae TaxID=34485 RepID=A0ACC2UTB3_9FUNG|nr:hypothetical protein DSO57_1007283 [Entomophthora muscae]
MELVFKIFVLEDLKTECLKLNHLKHLHIYGETNQEAILVSLHPVIIKLDSLYVDFYPYYIMDNFELYCGLKMLMMPLGEAEYIDTAEEFARISFDIVLVSSEHPIISAKSPLERMNRWLCCTDHSIDYFLKLSNANEFEGRHQFIDRGEKFANLLQGIYYFTESPEEIVRFTELTNFVEHCLIINYDRSDDRFSFTPFINAPSLDIKITTPHKFQISDDVQFQATKLSLSVNREDFPIFFSWASICFPHLQHFYVNNEISEMPPLSKNAFPCLVHFYTRFRQPESFWIDLTSAAPNLLYIHTDTIQGGVLEFEMLKPLLQVMPYININRHNGSIYQMYNFIKYILN